MFGIKRKIAIAALLAAGAILGAGWLTYLTEDAALLKVLKLGARGRRVVWSPDGKTLVVVTKVEKSFLGYQYDRRGSAIELWDLDKGEMRARLAESAQPGLAFQQVVFSADGKMIAAAEDNAVEVWDAKTLDVKQVLAGHRPCCIALSPDGKLLVAGDPDEKSILLWNVETGSLERTLDTREAQPWSLAFSPDGNTLVVGAVKDERTPESWKDVNLVSGQVQLWDAQIWTLKHVLKHENYVSAVAISPNGKLLASAGRGVLLWDAQTGERLHSLQELNSPTRTVAFSPDGQTVMAGGKDGKVRLWDVRTGKLIATLKGAGLGWFGASEIYSIAFSPDGKTLAAASQDQTVRLWKMPAAVIGERGGGAPT
jgi:WD40 repeat protein